MAALAASFHASGMIRHVTASSRDERPKAGLGASIRTNDYAIRPALELLLLLLLPAATHLETPRAKLPRAILRCTLPRFFGQVERCVRLRAVGAGARRFARWPGTGRHVLEGMRG